MWAVPETVYVYIGFCASKSALCQEWNWIHAFLDFIDILNRVLPTYRRVNSIWDCSLLHSKPERDQIRLQLKSGIFGVLAGRALSLLRSKNFFLHGSWKLIIGILWAFCYPNGKCRMVCISKYLGAGGKQLRIDWPSDAFDKGRTN